MPKLGLIVPYRNREKQLKIFKRRIQMFLHRDSGFEYTIIVVNQIDRKKFNRGKLLNIGFLEAEKQGCDYVIFHDVDMIPVKGTYMYDDKPLELVGEFVDRSSKFKRVIQPNYFGGVTLFPIEQFRKINGYSNKYKGWGFEDDDLLLRCRELGIPLDTLAYRSYKNNDNRALYFNGKNSYIKLDNTIKTVRSFSIVCSFYPDKIECDPQEMTDEFAVFGIPGHDLNLSFNSFSTYKFELFLKNNRPISLTTEYTPDLPAQVVVNVNPKLKRVQYFFNGKEVHTEYWNNNTIRLYEEEPFMYLGVAAPHRETKQKFFKGFLYNFALIHGELDLQDVRKLFIAGEKQTIPEVVPELKDRLFTYFTSDSYSKYTSELTDLSGYNNHGKVVNCEYIKSKTNKVHKLKMPAKRNCTYKLLKHDEGGYVQGYWTDWSSRENQLRYYRLLNEGDSNYDKDGLTTCKYKIPSTEEEENILTLNVLT